MMSCWKCDSVRSCTSSHRLKADMSPGLRMKPPAQQEQPYQASSLLAPYFPLIGDEPEGESRSIEEITPDY